MPSRSRRNRFLAPYDPRAARCLVLLGMFLAACGRDGGTTGRNFELVCDSSDTSTQTELFCIRSDTRSGEVLRVNHLSLPVSNGPTAALTSGPAGLFTTVCHATATNTRSDFYCIRLNTATGEMLLINLQKVGQLPSGN